MPAADAAGAATGARVAAAVRAATDTPAWRFLARRHPWSLLVPLVVVQWLALVAFAATVKHNGWLFYQGGDQTFYYTTSWLMSGWVMPTTPIGYGWSYLLSWIPLFSGTNLLGGLPAIVLVQALILMPVGTLAIYGIGSRLGGRLFGAWASILWVAGPYLTIPFWVERYHQKYTELLLPQALGLTGLADFPSMICLLVAAYFTLRALDTRDWRDAAIAGLSAAFAVGIKPANAIFLPAPVLALLLARRWRQLVPFAVAAAPPLVTLAVWKQRGLGQNPAVSMGGGTVDGVAAAIYPLASVLSPITRYIHFDWAQLDQNRDNMREFFFAVRPLEFLCIAGAIALVARSRPKAALVVVWFAAYFFLKGSSPIARVEDASFFRLIMPGYPAFFLLAVSMPLLVPTWGTRMIERFPPPRPRPIGRRRLVGAGLVFALIPLVIVVAIRQQRGPIAVNYYDQGVFVPVARTFAVTARQLPDGKVRVSWRPPETDSVKRFYRIFRVPPVRPDLDPNNVPDPVVNGLNCLPKVFAPGASDCRITMDTASVVSTTSFVDQPPPGKWVYRVGLSANWVNDLNGGDVLLLSAPSNPVSVPRR